jgi:uncharacterized tellurite resistance protein B-like protein
MSRSEDDSNPLVGSAFETPVGVFAFTALLASSGASFVSDLRASIAQLLGREGIEVAMRKEQARAKAELLWLAVIADGAITDAERAAIEAFAKQEGIDPEEPLAKIQALTEEVRDPVVLRRAVTHFAAPLDANERLEVFAAVSNLAHRGSRAWPEDTGYRGATAPTPAALIAAFREALGIRSTA